MCTVGLIYWCLLCSSVIVAYPENVGIGVVHLPRLLPLGEDLVAVHAVFDGVAVLVAFRLLFVAAPDCVVETSKTFGERGTGGVILLLRAVVIGERCL